MIEAQNSVGLWWSVLDSIHTFDKLEVNGVINGMFQLTGEEVCYVALYFRVFANVESMLIFRSITHFQGLAMLARSIFELSVGLELLRLLPGAWEKMTHLVEVEKLRHAKRLVEFASHHDTERLRDTSLQAQFIKDNAARITETADALWPSVKLASINHWTMLKLADRVRMLDMEMQETYERHYAQLSWAAHGGLTSVLDRQPEAFASFTAVTYELARRSYERVLEIVIHKFRLSTHDQMIGQKMASATLLPFTEGSDAVDQLLRHLGL